MPFPTMSAAIEGYLITKASKRLSVNTLTAYRVDLERLAQWLKDPPINKVTSKQIEAFFTYLNTEPIVTHRGGHRVAHPKKLAAKSVQNAWSAINNFWKWAESEFSITNPFNIPFIKANTKPVDPVPLDEIQQLLKVCDKAVRKRDGNPYASRRPTAKRDRAIILTFIDTGVRVTELCELRFGALDLHGSRFLVTGKGDKDRFVYFGKICKQALWRYATERYPDGKTPSSEFVFVQRDGLHPLDRHSVRSLINRLGKIAGDDNLHPHRFRHTFAIQFLRNGGNIFELQRLLGHSSLDMVQHYARLAEMDLEKAARKSSPADNWRL